MQINDTLLSGASGFLGKRIYNELLQYGQVITLSRGTAALNIDLSKQIPSLPEVELAVHCAGKAHTVPKTEAERQAFFDVNVTGTSNLLKGLENNKLPLSFVLISTVAVYGCITGQMIDESHPLNAQDPYGKSKIGAEILVQDWCAKNNVICSILRLPLLVGENPPGNLGAMINGIKKGYYFNIAGGKAKKSMILVSDVAKLIPIVAPIGGTYNLTDGYHPSFNELSLSISTQLGINKPKNIPLWLANFMAGIGNLLGEKSPINSAKLSKITADLTFDDAKARKVLGWNPNKVLDNFKIR